MASDIFELAVLALRLGLNSVRGCELIYPGGLAACVWHPWFRGAARGIRALWSPLATVCDRPGDRLFLGRWPVSSMGHTLSLCDDCVVCGLGSLTEPAPGLS